MQPTRITSEANERVKRWKKLCAQLRFQKREGSCIAEGLHLAMAARDAHAAVRAVILREDAEQGEAGALARGFARTTPVYVLSEGVYESFTPVPRGAGIMLEVALPAAPAPEAIREQDALYLDGVQDSGNAGTLIRTAVASGVRVIAASPGSAGLWTPKVLRSAMGAHFGAVILEGVPAEQLPRLFSGQRLAADARGGSDLFATAGWERGSTVWMMGAEGPGLSEAALAVAERRLYIPIEAATESLNVAAAAAVCLFEQRRRRLGGA